MLVLGNEISLISYSLNLEKSSSLSAKLFCLYIVSFFWMRVHVQLGLVIAQFWPSWRGTSHVCHDFLKRVRTTCLDSTRFCPGSGLNMHPTNWTCCLREYDVRINSSIPIAPNLLYYPMPCDTRYSETVPVKDWCNSFRQTHCLLLRKNRAVSDADYSFLL